MTLTTERSYRINFPDSEEKSLIQNYQEQVDMVLDSPEEPNLIIRATVSDFSILNCNSKIDFVDSILKPIIQKAVNERHIDYEDTFAMILSRLDCKR